jgi:hypothetical protein
MGDLGQQVNHLSEELERTAIRHNGVENVPGDFGRAFLLA